MLHEVKHWFWIAIWMHVFSLYSQWSRYLLNTYTRTVLRRLYLENVCYLCGLAVCFHNHHSLLLSVLMLRLVTQAILCPSWRLSLWPSPFCTWHTFLLLTEGRRSTGKVFLRVFLFSLLDWRVCGHSSTHLWLAWNEVLAGGVVIGRTVIGLLL